MNGVGGIDSDALKEVIVTSETRFVVDMIGTDGMECAIHCKTAVDRRFGMGTPQVMKYSLIVPANIVAEKGRSSTETAGNSDYFGAAA